MPQNCSNQRFKGIGIVEWIYLISSFRGGKPNSRLESTPREILAIRGITKIKLQFLILFNK